MSPQEIERTLQTLVEHAWDREITWGQLTAWSENFTGETAAIEQEQSQALIALSRFIYFGKRLVREMLRSLYRDHFEAPLIQRIRRNLKDSRDGALIRTQFDGELAATRFVGLGNPSESGAHLLYYFRQINHLPKDLFVDFGTAFTDAVSATRRSSVLALDSSVSRYVFFDDLVGSAQQSSAYLSQSLARIRRQYPTLDLRFMSLFAMTDGLEKLNGPKLFDGKATCLFELDDSYKAFSAVQRYFSDSLGSDFNLAAFQSLAAHYGGKLFSGHPLGYRDGQLLLGFTHNTPDNTLPIFWNEGRSVPWNPLFVRYDKVY
jgi:hypothetical protein